MASADADAGLDRDELGLLLLGVETGQPPVQYDVLADIGQSFADLAADAKGKIGVDWGATTPVNVMVGAKSTISVVTALTRVSGTWTPASSLHPARSPSRPARSSYEESQSPLFA